MLAHEQRQSAVSKSLVRIGLQADAISTLGCIVRHSRDVGCEQVQQTAGDESLLVA
jgi:hypothetical protein